MSYIRSDGYRLTDPEDDAAFQVVVGDLQRLALNLAKGSDSSAYMTKEDVDSSAFLESTNDLSDVNNVATARTNLGLGTAAVFPSGSFLQAVNNLSDVTVAATARTNLGLGPLATPNISPTSLMRCNGWTLKATYNTPGDSGTHTFTGGSQWALIDMVGAGGGGGGGTVGNASGSGGGGGGGGGSRVIWFYDITASGRTTLSYAVGTGGGGGSTGAGNAGAAGTNTTVQGTSLVTADFGLAGGGANNGNGGNGGATLGGTGIIVLNSSAEGMAIYMGGDSGQPGRVVSFTYNGTGNITGVTAVGGKGGGVGGGSSYGFGGGGGSAGNSGNTGGGGVVFVWEI